MQKNNRAQLSYAQDQVCHKPLTFLFQKQLTQIRIT